MIDDDEDIAPLVFEMADEYETEAEANAAGAELVSNGIGATVEPIPAAELPEDGPRSGYRVMVLDHQLKRAREVLGLEAAVDRDLANPEDVMKPVKGKADWKLFAMIWLAAMIILPALAFFVTYWITSSQ